MSWPYFVCGVALLMAGVEVLRPGLVGRCCEGWLPWVGLSFRCCGVHFRGAGLNPRCRGVVPRCSGVVLLSLLWARVIVGGGFVVFL